MIMTSRQTSRSKCLTCHPQTRSGLKTTTTTTTTTMTATTSLTTMMTKMTKTTWRKNSNTQLLLRMRRTSRSRRGVTRKQWLPRREEGKVHRWATRDSTGHSTCSGRTPRTSPTTSQGQTTRMRAVVRKSMGSRRRRQRERDGEAEGAAVKAARQRWSNRSRSNISSMPFRHARDWTCETKRTWHCLSRMHLR